MASDFGVNNNTNLFNSMFGTTGAGSSTGGSSVLGDYALIQSGAYKKLLNAYYDEDRKNTGSGPVEETPEQKAEKTALATMKTAASDLKKAAAALNDVTALDEKTGKLASTADERLEKVKDFVKAYNSLLDGTNDVENSKVLQKTLWMIDDFKANQKLLGDAGIKIGADNKLTIDEEKFKAAKDSTLNTLFNGRNSMAGKVMNKAFDISNRVTETVAKMQGGTVYTDKGDYTKLDTSALYDKLF